MCYHFLLFQACTLDGPDQRLRFISSRQEEGIHLGLVWEVAWALGSPEEWARKQNNFRARYIRHHCTRHWGFSLTQDRLKQDRSCPLAAHSPSMRERPQMIRQIDWCYDNFYLLFWRLGDTSSSMVDRGLGKGLSWRARSEISTQDWWQNI